MTTHNILNDKVFNVPTKCSDLNKAVLEIDNPYTRYFIFEFVTSVRTFSWNWIVINFSIFWHFLTNSYKVMRDSRIFWEKKMGGGNGPKKGFFEFIEKCGHRFFLNLFCNESLYYLLCSYINLIFGKNLVPEIWVKMLSANQIAVLLNQLYLRSKMKK